MPFVTTQRVHLLATFATLAVAFFTLASLFGRHQYLELATHFRLQYALAASACLILLLAFHSWKLAPLALACAVLNWAFILPFYAAPRHAKPSGGIRLRLMHANVLGGNRDYAALASVVERERPDILLLQEFTGAWEENLRGLEAQYPYSKLAPRQGGSGMALFSRHPLEAAEVLALDNTSHLALFAKVNVGGVTLSVLALHPPTPMRPDKFENRNRQFERAASIMRETQGPKLLVGDLNTTMWSPYFRDLVRDSGLDNARQGFALIPSWPVPLPAPLQIPIDHCLVSGDLSVEAIRTGGRTGSDHRPLIVDLSFQGPPATESR
ncbi:MAG: endonuclease/exonuclease/phosphatase family protein [Acidobacteria bacterium]|nr:endonuclease/exonuclease/phosphatase family protein [Acidobacteriota bacterium]